MDNIALPAGALGGVGVLLTASIVIFRLMLSSYREERAQTRATIASERAQWAEERLNFEKRLQAQDNLNREERGRLEERMLRAEKHNDRCERRLNTLLVAAQQHGVPIPPEVWSSDA